MSTVLICCDKFKGSASSSEVADALTVGLRMSGHSVRSLPLADGGDGTLEVFDELGYRREPVSARGSDRKPISAEYSRDAGTSGRTTAVIEVARVCGLDMVSVDGEPPNATDAREAGSWGVGDLVVDALDKGAGRIILALGGSAITDAGFGMAQALGVVFLDGDGAPVTRVGDLARTRSADVTGADPRLATLETVIASDVRNPLCGDDGAAAVYGPQKGLSPETVPDVDTAIRGFAYVVEHALGTSGVIDRPGAGAAGGLGFMALALLGAQMRSGVDLVLEEMGFAGELDTTDLVITGEGRIDTQTLSGKAPAGVAERARNRGVPVIAVCGQNQLEPSQGHNLFTEIHSLTDDEPDVVECIRNPLPILERIGERIGERKGRNPLLEP